MGQKHGLDVALCRSACPNFHKKYAEFPLYLKDGLESCFKGTFITFPGRFDFVCRCHGDVSGGVVRWSSAG